MSDAERTLFEAIADACLQEAAGHAVAADLPGFLSAHGVRDEDVAAVAATSASSKTSMFGIARPMKDIVVHVGGANAGNRLSANTTMNSTPIT